MGRLTIILQYYSNNANRNQIFLISKFLILTKVNNVNDYTLTFIVPIKKEVVTIQSNFLSN